MMSQEQLKAFLAKAAKDPSLQEKIKQAGTAEQLSALAKAEGFDISVSSLSASVEISEDELESVAGGGITPLLTGFVCQTVMKGLQGCIGG